MNQNNEEPSFVISSDDPEMQEAIKLAQSEFHIFFDEIINESKRIVPVMEECLIKYAFQSEMKDVEMEHMFLTGIFYNGEKIVGYLDSEPRYISSIKKGDLVFIEKNRVTDWLYTLDVDRK